MPEIHPSSIVSFSSEDKNYPSSNILKGDGFHKWKCATAGEKQAVMELQFDKPVQINQIDIGNEGSAFVEVLVNRSSSCGIYQVLLVSSSFMSPMDARSNTGLNRVRIFASDKLTSQVASEKWDRVKVVCTQPFSRTLTYGLAFIKFFTPTAGENPGPAPKARSFATLAAQHTHTHIDDRLLQLQKTLSKFVVKGGDDEEEEDMQPGSLFASKKQSKADSKDSPDVPSSVSSQLRASSRVAESSTAARKSPRKSAAADKAEVKPANTASRRHSISSESTASVEPADSASQPKASRKTASTPDSNKSSDKKGPAGREFAGVSFVLSGFQNPLRGQLRDKAIALGAKYKPDWGPGCTHLISAFSNTPKFSQVRGKGCIVTSDWIIDSHRQQKKLPWRRYRQGRAPSPPGISPAGSEEEEEDPSSRRRTATRVDYSESEEEEEEVKKKPTRRRRKEDSDSNDSWTPQKTGAKSDDDELPSEDDVDKDDDGSHDNKKKTKTSAPPAKRQKKLASLPSSSSTTKPSKADISSDDSDEGWKPVRRKQKSTSSPDKTPALTNRADEEDTDEEIQRAMDASDTTKPKPTAKDQDDSSTDVEDVGSAGDPRNRSVTPDLPCYFTGKKFLLYGTFEPEDRRFIQRLIVAFDGALENYMSGQVNVVVTRENWDKNFDDALATNNNLSFVRPDWILACDKAGRRVPYQKYQVVDDS